MSMKMGKDYYEKLIKENIEWIEQFPDTLERKHIKHRNKEINNLKRNK